MVTNPDDIAADPSGGAEEPKEGPTAAGVTAPPRDEQGTPVAPDAATEEEPPPEGDLALETEMADAESLPRPGATPTRPAPTPERR
jgi:hypothetical protein